MFMTINALNLEIEDGRWGDGPIIKMTMEVR